MLAVKTPALVSFSNDSFKVCYWMEKKFQLKIFSSFTGLILCGVGLILTIMFYVIQGLSYSLLGGLVPLVIGLCLILFYKLCPASIEKDGEN